MVQAGRASCYRRRTLAQRVLRRAPLAHLAGMPCHAVPALEADLPSPCNPSQPTLCPAHRCCRCRWCWPGIRCKCRASQARSCPLLKPPPSPSRLRACQSGRAGSGRGLHGAGPCVAPAAYNARHTLSPCCSPLPPNSSCQAMPCHANAMPCHAVPAVGRCQPPTHTAVPAHWGWWRVRCNPSPDRHCLASPGRRYRRQSQAGCTQTAPLAWARGSSWRPACN